jgi:deoxyribonuclease V
MNGTDTIGRKTFFGEALGKWMEIKHLHSWHLSPKEAAVLQKELAGQVEICPLPSQIQTIAGLDCAFSRDGRRIAAVIAVLSFPTLEVVEIAEASDKVQFPYVPGLLSFREAPVCLKAAGKLRQIPDVFLADGQGIAHPRRLGLASHLGLFLNRPTIGCAKSRLCGVFEEPAAAKGSRSLLWENGEVVGMVLRTRCQVRPLFVSVGHRAVLEEAAELVLQCCRRYRLPEPTRLAHQKVSILKTALG